MKLKHVSMIKNFITGLLLLMCSFSLFAQEMIVQWSDEGPSTTNAQRGKSLAYGDINGDGYQDLIVGEPNSDEVHIYNGNPAGFPSSPSQTITNTNTGWKFGQSVASGSDLDGDGNDDVVISRTASGANGGSVYIYFGSSSGVGTAYIEIDGLSGHNFGWDIDMSGDFSGNGTPDIVVGAPAEAALGTDWYDHNGFVNTTVSGVYVFYSENLTKPVTTISLDTDDADWEVEQTTVYQDYGYAVSFTGDLNGDGDDDLIVGDPFVYDEGRVFVYGFDGGSTQVRLGLIEGHGVDETEFGKSLTGLDDVNGDGRADILIGAPATANSSEQGEVFVFFGESSTSAIDNNWETYFDADWSFTGISGQNDANFGIRVAQLGDINFDGINDFAVSARDYNDGSSNDAGMVRIYHGTNSSTKPTATTEIVGSNAGDKLGQAMCAYSLQPQYRAGIVIGSPWHDNGGTSDRGLVEHYADFVTDAHRGRAIANLGDINSDGLDDLAVGLPGIGRTEIYTTSSTGALTLSSTINHGGHAGISLAAVDLDQDGDKDLVIGDDEFDDITGIAYFHFNDNGTFPAIEDHSIEGTSTDYRFAFDMANAGDINNDGYDDLLVGSPGLNTNVGRGYAWFSATSQSNFTSGTGTPDWDYTALPTNSRFGHSVAAAGDIDGDGYNDVIIGDNKEGAAYVFLGNSTGLNSSYEWKGTHTASTKFGAAVSGGDIDGDGFSDIVVGAPKQSSTYGGRAYVWYGASSLTSWSTFATSADWDTGDGIGYSGSPSANKTGQEVLIAPSLDEDNIADLVVGATEYDYYGPSGVGAVKIFYGATNRNLDCKTTLIEAPTHSSSDDVQEFGNNFAPISDLNADGANELAIGARYRDLDGDDDGEVFVQLGSAGSTDLGKYATAGGDINGDGYGDLIVVNQTEDLLQVLYGSQTGYSSTPDWSTRICDLELATSAGDINDDGYSDILVGCPSANNNDGYIAIFKGGQTPEFFWEKTGNTGDELGSAIALVGTATGTESEIVVGAPGNVKVYVWFGSQITNALSGGVAASGNELYTGTSGSGIGSAVSSAGDFNNDGRHDIIIGEPGNAKAHIFIYDWSSGYPSTPSWSSNWPSGAPSGSEFGFDVACAGDVNSDGFSDVIIGDPGVTNGAAYLWIGNGAIGSMSTDPALADYEFLGSQAGSRFGENVSIVGDFNIDGYADVMISAPNFDYSGNNNCGQVQVFYGNEFHDFSTLDPSEYYGAAASENLGEFLSNAGDINGDGLSDIVFGSSQIDFAVEEAIPSYLGSTYFDKGEPNSGHTGNDTYGSSLMNIGDVNGDGLDDFAVGSRSEQYTGAQGQAGGVVYVYYGTETGLLNASGDFVTYKGFSSEYGYSVSGGDLNGDGYSDLIIGAPNSTGCNLNISAGNTFPNRGKFDGKVFVFLGSASGLNGGVSGVNHSNADWIISGGNLSSGNTVNNGIGHSVASLDLNGDGFSDLVASKPSSLVSGSTYESVISIFYGGTSFPAMSGCNSTTDASTQYDIQIKRPECDYMKVANAGDIDGDGFDDLLFSYKETTSGNEFVEVFYGLCNDLCIDDAGSGDCGKTSIGSSDLPNWKATIGTSSTTNHLGYAISTAGDVNGDGYSDIVIGAPHANGYDGTVYVLKGSSTGLPGNNDGTTNNLSSLSLWKVEGGTDMYLGASVSTAGDIDGQGYDDVAFTSGQWENDPETSTELKATVYVFVSEDNGDKFQNVTEDLTNADWEYSHVFTGVDAYSSGYLNTSLSTLGDYNNDGFSDLGFGVIGFWAGSGVNPISDVRTFMGNLGDNKPLYTAQWQETQVGGNDVTVQTGNVSDPATSSPSCKIEAGYLGYSNLGKMSAKLQWEIIGNGDAFENGSGDLHRYSEGPATSSPIIKEETSFSTNSVLTLDAFEPDGADLINQEKVFDDNVSGDIPSGQAFNWRMRMAFQASDALDGKLYSRWMYVGQGDRDAHAFRLAEGDCREYCTYNPAPFEEELSTSELAEWSFNMYPNPANNQLAVELENIDGKARILNMNGKEMLTNINLVDGTNQLNISSLAEGMYILEVQTENGVNTQKFMKK